MMKHHQIQYIEFLTNDFGRIRSFYEGVFGWEFTLWSPEYMSFSGDLAEGGFAKGDPVQGSVLVILYSEDLEASYQAVVASDAQIQKEIFSFPGGRRFEFLDPDGNHLAVWTTNM